MAKANPEQIRESIALAMKQGKIRTFGEQLNDLHATGEIATPLEVKARRMYLLYILNTENPRTLP